MAEINIDTGRTLSVFTRPGQDTRIPTTKSQSIFTFGSFRIERDLQGDSITGETKPITFGPFSTLQNMQVEEFEPRRTSTVDNRELKFNKEDPLSYSYFSSFYTTVANAINNIIDEFPYAILAQPKDSGNTIINYSTSKENGQFVSSFRIPLSSTTNQGQVRVNSGRTDEINLVRDKKRFAVQLSGSSQTVHKIKEYKFIPPTGSTSFMEFKIEGKLFENLTGTTSQKRVYIRPSKQRLNTYLSNLSRIERQVWLEQKFLIPDAEIPERENIQKFEWPKSIDGFNPDTFGSKFDDYKDNILNAAERVDEEKTNIMFKALLPQNFLEQDTEENDFRTLTEIYAQQFDELKQFIDSIAFAHNINYDEEESVPNKFLFKLSNLLGWELSESFNELNLFEYLVGDIENNKQSLTQLNVEIWKRILININWLYKKKGTRDALQFIFKLIGAPDCLINLNEFVYEINKTISPTPEQRSDFGFDLEEGVEGSRGRLANEEGFSPDINKINNEGFINYQASESIFQEGGKGRGNGQEYINQWRPEFDPTPKVDNIKIQTGDPRVGGSQNIINSKELQISISPADAIECDLLEWLQSTGVCWVWGTTGSSFSFSSLTVPFEYLPADCDPIDASNISGMTFAQFAEHIYSKSIDPRVRKTVHQDHNSFWYQELKKIYLLYYFNESIPSNKLNFQKLEFFVNLLEVQFQDYFLQLIPATTIFDGAYTEYRNTLFNRQKHVYKEGINRGSEFQEKFSEPLSSKLDPQKIDSQLNQKVEEDVRIINVNGTIPTKMKMEMNPVLAVSNFPTKIEETVSPFKIESTIQKEN